MPNDYRSLLLGFNNTHNVLIVWKRLPVMWTPSLPHHRHSSADITGYRRQTNIRCFVIRMQRFLIIKFVIWQLDLYLGLLVHFFVSFFNHLFINIIPWRSRSTVLVLMLLLEGVWNLVIQSAESWWFLQSTLLGLLLFNFAIITLTADRGISRWEFILWIDFLQQWCLIEVPCSNPVSFSEQPTLSQTLSRQTAWLGAWSYIPVTTLLKTPNLKD